MSFDQQRRDSHARTLDFYESNGEEFVLDNDFELTSLVILNDFKWISELIEFRVKEVADPKNSNPDLMPLPPNLETSGGHYAAFVVKHNLSLLDRILLVTTLIPYTSPDIFNSRFIEEERKFMLKYPEAGGVIDKLFLKFLPTVHTCLFLAAGTDKVESLRKQLELHQSSRLVKDQIVEIKSSRLCEDQNDFLNYLPRLAPEYLESFMTGVEPRPDFGKDFPARVIRTNATWDQLIVSDKVRKKVDRLMKWLEHSQQLIDSDINPSFPCLFYGPSGTGKTMTAKLIGKTFKKLVFRVDLSTVVSKYIGETEKNLAALFDRAEGRDWILFFDEADSLFGKRTDIKESNDKYANLEINYLLQRIEEYRGLVILASNLKENLDKALARRFQVLVEFQKPTVKEQLLLWQKLLPKGFTYHAGVQLDTFATYKFTGANIANILKIACLETVSSNSRELRNEVVKAVIREELEKESRTV